MQSIEDIEKYFQLTVFNFNWQEVVGRGCFAVFVVEVEFIIVFP